MDTRQGAQGYGAKTVSPALVPLPCSLSLGAKMTVTTVDVVKSPVGGSPSSHQGLLGAISHDIHETSQVASISGQDSVLDN